MSLAAALVEAQKAAHAVYKGSKNEFHRYRYASAEDMIEESRGALHSAGLALITLGWSCAWNPPEGDRFPRGLVKVKYRLVHTSGESIDFDCETTSIVEKGRPEDKAEATALTYNLGYFLRGLLCLPRSDEKGVDERDDRDYTPPREPSKPKPQVKTDAPKLSSDELTVAILKATKNTELAQLGMQIKYQPEADRPGLSKVYNDRMNVLLKGKNGEPVPPERDELPTWAGGTAEPESHR